MDLVTHALLGATVTHAAAPLRGARLRPRERLLLRAIAAAFPDIDFAGFLINPLVFLADWHQGPTRSIVLLPVWAILIAAVFVRVAGRAQALAEAAAISALGLLSHIKADLITVYGTMVLFPLSRWRASIGTTFLIDPLFTGIVVASLMLGVVRRHFWATRTALVVLCAYVASQGVLQQRALNVLREQASAHGISFDKLLVLPQPFSPFNWKLIASNDTMHH